MSESFIGYFLIIICFSVLGSSLRLHSKLPLIIITSMIYLLAFVLGSFNEINKYEYVVVCLYFVLFIYFNPNQVELKYFAPIIFSPILFVFDNESQQLLVFKLFTLVSLYTFCKKSIDFKDLSNTLIFLSMFISLNVTNSAYSLEMTLFLFCFSIFINLLLEDDPVDNLKQVQNLITVLLLLKLTNGTLAKVDLETSNTLISLFIFLLTLILLFHTAQKNLSKLGFMALFVIAHHVVFSLLNGGDESIAIALWVWVIILFLSIFLKFDKSAKLIIIVLSFLFIFYEALVLNNSLPILCYSILLKVLFIYIGDIKFNANLNKKML